MVGEPAHAKIGVMFPDDFDEVIVAPGLSNEREDWLRLADAIPAETFGLNTPLVLHPLLNIGLMPRAVLFAIRTPCRGCSFTS